jgi:hypothetical protein
MSEARAWAAITYCSLRAEKGPSQRMMIPYLTSGTFTTSQPVSCARPFPGRPRPLREGGAGQGRAKRPRDLHRHYHVSKDILLHIQVTRAVRCVVSLWSTTWSLPAPADMSYFTSPGGSSTVQAPPWPAYLWSNTNTIRQRVMPGLSFQAETRTCSADLRPCSPESISRGEART